MPDDFQRVTIRSGEADPSPQDSSGLAKPGWSANGSSVGQVHSVTFGQGQQPTTPGFMRVTTSEIAPRDESQGVLSTARSHKSGGPVSGRGITRDSIVVVHGMETTVAAATAMGLLQVNPATGLYEDTTQGYNSAVDQHRQDQQRGTDRYANSAPVAPPAAPPSNSDNGGNDDQSPQQNLDPNASTSDEIAPFNEELEGHIADFQKVGNMDFAAGMSQMVTTGELSDNTAGLIASQLGINAEEVRSRAGALMAAFDEQAREMTGAGDALPEILKTMRERDPDMVDRAIRDHVEEGKRTAYDGVIRQYIYDLPSINPRLILDSPDAEARGVRMERNGELTLEIPGVGRIRRQSPLGLSRLDMGSRRSENQ